MSEPPLKKKRRTILDFYQRISRTKCEVVKDKVDLKGTQEAHMATSNSSGNALTSQKLPGSIPGSEIDKNDNKNLDPQKTKLLRDGKCAPVEGKDHTKSTQEANMANKNLPGSTPESGESNNVNENSDSKQTKLGKAASSTDKSSPGPDDGDICEQESEDWEETLDSQSSDNFLSSSRAIPIKKPTPRKDGSQAWKGIPVKGLKKMPDCEEKLGPLKGSESHVVLFQTPYEYKEQSPPKPYAHYKDKWDHYHVRMPCSDQNEFPVQEKHGKKIVRRWDIITRALSGDIKDINDLEAAIISYSHRYFEKWDFQTLHYFFTKDLEEQECREFFSKTMKKMQKLAQKLPHLCSHPIPLLKKGQSKSVTFSQQQIACLLANAFFCTFPQRNAKQRFSEFPSINFSSLFTGKPDSVKMEKLRCILHYFTRVCEKTPCGTVTITRMHKSESHNWDEMNTHLLGLHVSSEGTIEDDGEGMLQVDFANKFLGGGVLSHGCVQEEIRFLICPEMIISRLITEELAPNEALVMRGCERFSDYDGYSSTFKWKGSYTDKTSRDQWGRIYCEVVAIDALVFRNYKSQFNHDFVLRELSKAYCGFFRRLPQEHLPAVCTGNWGCGAFGGDCRLKALIQLMAAAHARRDVCYFTYDDEKLRDDFYKIHSYLTTTNRFSIGDLVKIIEEYRKNIILKSQGKPEMNIFEFILRIFDGSLENTDEYSHSSYEMRFLKESGRESSFSSRGATGGVTLNVNWESESNTASLKSTSKSSTSRQYSQETQIQKLDMSTAKSPKGLALPSHWAPIETGVVSVLLDPNDRKQTIRDEYAKVAKHFEKSMTNAEIKSIKRIQNVLLWQHYALRKKEMEGKSGVGNVNEMHLYHGTIPDTVELICEENFDFRNAGSRKGALYGQGTYFALEAKISDSYAHIDGNNHKFMFVAQVLVGKICLGIAEYKKPPYLDE
ncbi:hypothetical protein CHS0354_001021, partial [Potamilus streckersoni]